MDFFTVTTCEKVHTYCIAEYGLVIELCEHKNMQMKTDLQMVVSKGETSIWD